MNKKKIFKIILIILALVLLFFVVRTVRNYIIITDLQNKIAEYSNSTNHHIKIVSNQSDGTILTTNYYKKDDKEVVFLERNLNGELTKISMYENGESRNMYTETKDNKVVNLHSGFIEVQIFNGTETDNLLQTIISSIVANITSVSENGKSYYKLSNVLSPYSLSFDGETVLVDKDTGLLYKNVSSFSTVEREFEFGNVDDSIFVEPDISEYTVNND